MVGGGGGVIIASINPWPYFNLLWEQDEQEKKLNELRESLVQRQVHLQIEFSSTLHDRYCVKFISIQLNL